MNAVTEPQPQEADLLSLQSPFPTDVDWFKMRVRLDRIAL